MFILYLNYVRIIDFVNCSNRYSLVIYSSRASKFRTLSRIIPSFTSNKEYKMSGLSFHTRKVKNNKSSSDRYNDGVTLGKHGVVASVHTARAVRTEMSK